MVWLFLCLILGALTLIVFSVRSEGYEVRPWLIASLVIAWIIVMFSPLVYEFPGSTTPVTFEGSRSLVHPYGCFEWPWQKTVSFPEILASQNVVILTPQTPKQADRPSIKRITVNVEIKINDLDKFYRLTDRRDGSRKEDFETILESQLYEWRKRHEKGLADIGDPNDPLQQAVVDKLIKDELNPLWADDGAEVMKTSFKTWYLP